MHIGRTQSATRWFRFLNLTLLLAFLPMGVLGSRFHSLLHRHSCASHDSSQHVLAADLLAWFDAGNRSLDDLLLGLERSWQTPSHAEACEARGTEAIHNGEITPGPVFSGGSSVLVVVERAGSPAVLPAEPSAVSTYFGAAPPTRAGPEWSAPQTDCDDRCQLCLSLRQIQFVAAVAPSIEPLPATILGFSLADVQHPQRVVTLPSSRGPPTAI